jgi:hypothetical protein
MRPSEKRCPTGSRSPQLVRVAIVGGGINLLPHATRELTELGLLDALLAVGIPLAGHTSVTPQRVWV